MVSRIMQFLTKNNLTACLPEYEYIYSGQHGFRVADCLNAITRALGTGKLVIVVF